MNTIEKYKYLDWWSGKICLENATIWINNDYKGELPIRVSWEQIEQHDISKIKEKQIEIFDASVTEKLKIWQEQFKKRYSKSELPDILLDDELNKFCGILFDPIPNDTSPLYINGIFFNHISIVSIKCYISIIKINGEDFDFDVIHSTNCIYQNNVVNSTVIFAETCWRYIKWLETFGKLEINKPDNGHPSTDDVLKDPANPHPDIFKNGYSYNLFLELKEALVIEGRELADYSFIFKKLKFNTPPAINSGVSHKIFIEFLNRKHNAGITSPKLNSSTTSRKEGFFILIFEKYQALI